MKKAIIYKEFLKTKWVLLCIVLVFAAYLGYLFLNISKSAEVNGLGSIWSYMIAKDSPLFENFRLFPLLAGVVLAIASSFPRHPTSASSSPCISPIPRGR